MKLALSPPQRGGQSQQPTPNSVDQFLQCTLDGRTAWNESQGKETTALASAERNQEVSDLKENENDYGMSVEVTSKPMSGTQAFPPDKRQTSKGSSLLVTEEDQRDIHAPPIMMKFKSLGHNNFNTYL